MLISTVVFLFFLFLVYALFLLATRKADDRQERLQQRVAEALQSSHSSDDPVQISRDDTIGGSPTINRLLSSIDFIRRFDRMIRQADMDITVGLNLGAVHGAAHGSAAIEQTQPAREVDAGQWWPPLALPGLKRELQEGDLHPVIGCDGEHADS